MELERPEAIARAALLTPRPLRPCLSRATATCTTKASASLHEYLSATSATCHSKWVPLSSKRQSLTSSPQPPCIIKMAFSFLFRNVKLFRRISSTCGLLRAAIASSLVLNLAFQAPPSVSIAHASTSTSPRPSENSGSVISLTMNVALIVCIIARAEDSELESVRLLDLSTRYIEFLEHLHRGNCCQIGTK